MDKNLLALRKSIGDFSVLDKIPEHIVVPVEWYSFTELSTEESIRYVATLWSKYYGEELRVLLEVFKEYLTSVQLIEHDRKIALLYTYTILATRPCFLIKFLLLLVDCKG